MVNGDLVIQLVQILVKISHKNRVFRHRFDVRDVFVCVYVCPHRYCIVFVGQRAGLC